MRGHQYRTFVHRPPAPAPIKPAPKARVTVWYSAAPLRGSWHPTAIALFTQQFYEYGVGVPATLEYRA